MLENCYIDINGDFTQRFSKGQLAEALIFYDRVTISCDIMKIPMIVAEIGEGNFIEILNRNMFELVITDDSLAVNTRKRGLIPVHDIGTFSFAGDQKVGKLTDIDEKIEYLIKDRCSDISNPNQLIKSITEVTRKINLFRDFYKTKPCSNFYSEILFEKENLLKVLNAVSGSLSKSTILAEKATATKLEKSGFMIATDLDIHGLNLTYRENFPNREADITLPLILNLITRTIQNLIISCTGNATLSCSAAAESIVAAYASMVSDQINKEKREIFEFSEYILSNGKAIQETIDNNRRTFKEFLDLLEKKHDFNKWKSQIPDDRSLLGEYVLELTSGTYFEKTPEKWFKFGSMTALSVILDIAPGIPYFGTAITTLLTLLDEKVHHHKSKSLPLSFVQRPLRQFVARR